MITSATNPRVQWVRRLQRRRRAREQEGLFVVEGLRLADEARRSGTSPRWVVHSDPLPPRAAELVAVFARRGAQVLPVSERVLKACAATEAPQGLLLVVPIPDRPFPSAASLVVVADGLADPGNLGTLLRTCLAAGVDGVVLTSGSVDPYNPKVVRAAMGAHFHLPIQRAAPDITPAMLAGLSIWTAQPQGGMPYHQVDARTPLALVVGGEAHGTSPFWRDQAQGTISVPMSASVESLNAVVAAAIILFEIRRQRETA